MRHYLYILLCLLLSVEYSNAQCYCEDCPEPIIFGSPSTATLNVSGATNNILGAGGQSLVNVGLQFTHDAAQELSLRIVAPDGSFVDLTIGEGLDFGQNNNFEIDFVQCAAAPMPDCTNSGTWSSLDEWDEGPYTGSYLPEVGCLEDLTGDVNGTWTLEMEDVFIIEDGELFCFNLTFADDTGISCNSAPCDQILCLAQGGNSIAPDEVMAPEGDPSLIIDYTVSYNDCEFPPSGPEYIYVYLIFDAVTETLLEIVEGTVDMTSYAEGTYIVRGLSILAADLPVLEALNFPSTSFFDLVLMIQAGTVCADFAPMTSVVTIDGCIIDFLGTLEADVINAEVADPALDPDWTITWLPFTPDFSTWGVYYVVYDQVTGVIIDYLTTDDFTGLPEGDYFVSVVVYLLSDETQLPPADGTSTFTDLENATLTEDVCGLTFGQNELYISEPCMIDADGTLELENITAPQGDPSLDPDWDITFSGSTPDPLEYGFYFVVYDAVTDVLIELYTTDDFTLLLEGKYTVTVLYFDLDDEPSILTPNGVNTFADIVALIDGGVLCAQYFGENELCITPPCLADAGSFSTNSITECQGNDALMLDLTPSYTSGEPDQTQYGYTYVISQNGIVIDIDESEDFTGYDIGAYEICGFSYLLADVGLLPSPNGSLNTAAILNDIANQTYCADLMTDCITLTIIEVPIPIFTGPTEVCVGESVQYEVENFNGNISDYTFFVQDGGYSALDNNGDGTIDITWTAGPGNICVTQYNDECEEEICIAVDILPLPEFTIDGPAVFCPGDELIYTFDPTPVGGEYYEVIVSGGMIVGQTVNTATIQWDDIDIGNLTVSLLGGMCDSESDIFVVNVISDVDFPQLTIPGSSCLSSTLSIPDIGDPEIISWEWTATNADILIMDGMVNFTWQTLNPAEICLEVSTACSVESMCYDIEILEIPYPVDLMTICDGDNYVVEFDIAGSSGPYTVNGGVVDGSEFTSVNIMSGEVYTFYIEDGEGCFSEIIQGTEVCNCTTEAGTMATEEITLCAVDGEIISGTFNNDATFDGDDVGSFVLHTGSSNILGTVLDMNDLPEFLYGGSYGSGITIYISYVVGDSLTDGSLDFDDECLSVSFGQPVNIVDLLQTEAGNYDNQCDFAFNLNADDQGELGTWNIVDSPSGAIVNFGDPMDAQSSFEADLPGTYSITWQPIDAACVLPDTVTFELHSILGIESREVDCEEDLQSYTVSLEISGGVTPYFLDGSEIANPFDIPAVVSGEPYSHVLTDSRGCELLIEGAENCDCMNAPGSMATDTLRGCLTDTLMGTYNNDALLDINDRELFVLHTSSADTLGAVFYISDDPIVFYLPILIPGNVYYLSHIIGNEEGMGIDFEDPCFQVSMGQPVIFNLPPEVSAGEDQQICGLSTILEGSSSEQITTWSIIQTPFGAVEIIDENDPTSEFNVNIPGEYILGLEADNGYCTSNDTVSIIFTEELSYSSFEIVCVPSGYVVGFTINGGSGTYFIDGIALEGNVFSTDSIIPTGNDYSFVVTDSQGCPELLVVGEDTCECENDAGSMVPALVEICIDDIIDLNTLHNFDAILNENDVQYHVVHTSSTIDLGDVLFYDLFINGVQELSFDDAPFEIGVIYYVSTVLAIPGVLEDNEDYPCLKVAEGTPIVWRDYNTITFNNDIVACAGDIAQIDLTVSGELPFEVTISDDLGFSEVLFIDQENFEFEYLVTEETILTINASNGGTCLTIEDGELVVAVEDLPTAEVRASVSICNSAAFGSILNLNDLIISGFAEGRWLFNGAEIVENIDFDGFDAGEYELEYLIESEICSTSNIYTVSVLINDCECPMFDYTSQDITCFGEEDGIISILALGGVDLADFTVTLNNSEVISGSEISGLSSGSYALDITDGNDCISSFEIDILEPAPVQISLGEDVEAVINDPVVIEAITNLLVDEIEGITWTSLEGILDDNDLLLNTSFQNDDMVSIDIIDENGCTASDELMVRVTIEDYIIPNVINTNSISGNDVFRIYNGRAIDEIVSMAIYDRWGNEVFGVENVMPDSELAQWDGTFGGSRLSTGVYVYKFVLLVKGEEQVVFGDLTLL